MTTTDDLLLFWMLLVGTTVVSVYVSVCVLPIELAACVILGIAPSVEFLCCFTWPVVTGICFVFMIYVILAR